MSREANFMAKLDQTIQTKINYSVSTQKWNSCWVLVAASQSCASETVPLYYEAHQAHEAPRPAHFQNRVMALLIRPSNWDLNCACFGVTEQCALCIRNLDIECSCACRNKHFSASTAWLQQFLGPRISEFNLYIRILPASQFFAFRNVALHHFLQTEPASCFQMRLFQTLPRQAPNIGCSNFGFLVHSADMP